MQSINPMNDLVGQTAGDIFHWLQTHSSSGDLASLRKELNHVDERVLLQGMGWLMREGKIEVQPQGPGNNANMVLRLQN